MKQETLAARLVDRLRYQVLQRHESERAYIFGIGLAKTATTTFCDALDLLGHNALHYAPIADIVDGRPKLNWHWWMNKYDAAADVPVAAVFQELDARFPNARFVLTHRDLDPWLESCRKHFNQAKFDRRRPEPRFVKNRAVNQAIYGTNVYDRAKFTETYHRHTERVLSHFKGREDFITLDLTKGEGWGPLCAFLGHPVPEVPFPHSNRHKPIPTQTQ